MSFVMKEMSSCTSMQGCRASLRMVSPVPRGCILGRMYGIGACEETCAKETITSRCAITPASLSITGQYEAMTNCQHLA